MKKHMVKRNGQKKIMRRAGAMVLCAAMMLGNMGTAFADGSGMESGKYYSDYSSLEETLEASLEVNQQIAEESIVLLKNSNDTLPLSGVKNISVFGKDSADFYYAGGGSGTAEGYYEDDEYYTFYQSLKDAGYSINPKLESFYEDDAQSGTYESSDSNYVCETDVDTFPAGIQGSYARYHDAAIIVIGRTGSEGGDLYTGSTVEGAEEKHALELTDEEVKLVEHVTANFDKVIVILNSPQQMELGWIEDGTYGEIDAAIWVGHTGQNGTVAIGEVLNGTINPSGRLADIYAADFTKDPTYANVYDNHQTENGTSDYIYTDEEGNVEMFHSLEYEEGIYYGYRYYETRGYEEEQSGNAGWYDENVVYPFGYGLSYTSFDWQMGEVQKAEDENGDTYYTVDVTVTNTGSVSGKDVVQLYYTAPYITGQIEKSQVVLGDFAKTDLLAPGKSQTVTLSIYEQDMASYDYNDANGNGHTGYELDAGSYGIKIMKNSHDVVAEQTIDIEATNYDTDRTTGATVENRFSNDDDYNSMGGLMGDMTSMTRADFAGTFPTTPTSETIGPEETPVIELDEETYNKIRFSYEAGADDDETDQAWYDYYNSMDMSNWTQEAEVTIMAEDLVGLDADDETWTEFMNQLTIDEMRELTYNGGYKTIAIERVGLPASEQADGPVAIKGKSGTKDSGIQWVSNINVAATWNVELAELRGIMVGNEALQLGLNGWYAPGVNLHRSPFGGRNFEYYAEDGLLAGKMSAAVINGCQSKGVICFVKHFAVNNQEEDRGAALPGMATVSGSSNGLMTWVSEQAMRECYFKAFEISVKEADARGCMTSMNQIGLHSNSNNFELVMGVLREEWGFQGYTVTDVVPASPNNSYADTETLVKTGIDTILGAGNEGIGPVTAEWDASLTNKDGGQGSVLVNGEQNDITYAALRAAAQRVIFATVNSCIMKNEVSLDAFADVTAPDGTIGVSYSGSVAIAEEEIGTDDTVYTMTDGDLPEGLSFTSTGALEGTPVESGTFEFTVNLTADGWMSTEQTFTLNIVNDIFESTVGDGTVGQEYNASLASAYLTEDGSTLDFSVSEGELPAGLTLNADGTITGVPEAAGTYSVRICAHLNDPEGSSAQDEMMIMMMGGTVDPDEYYLNYTITVTE